MECFTRIARSCANQASPGGNRSHHEEHEEREGKGQPRPEGAGDGTEAITGGLSTLRSGSAGHNRPGNHCYGGRADRRYAD